MKKYKPKHLREPDPPEIREVSYGIGTERSPGEFGMYCGPVPTEEDLLEVEGSSNNDYLIRFNMDGSEDLLWRWDMKEESWVEYLPVLILNMRKGSPIKPWDFRIDRNTPVGNPFKMLVDSEEERNRVCEKYEEWFLTQINDGNEELLTYISYMEAALKKYRFLRLFCWCSPLRCHGETIKDWLLL